MLVAGRVVDVLLAPTYTPPPGRAGWAHPLELCTAGELGLLCAEAGALFAEEHTLLDVPAPVKVFVQFQVAV